MTTELERLCRKYQIIVDCVYGAAEPWPDEWAGQECHPWTVTLSWPGPRGRRSGQQQPLTLTVSFFQGAAYDGEPAAADVLSSLLLDMEVEDYSSLEDWAEALGYDTDSRKVYRTYRGCLKMAQRVRTFLGGDEELIEELRRAEH